jgi:hypothetical protein
MAFSILDYLDQLETSNEPGKYLCPACGGNDFSVNKKTGAYSCWHDPSPEHRAEIRNVLAPMVRWEKPARSSGHYCFSYENLKGEVVVKVNRDDDSGAKKIWQEFPTIDHDSPSHKTTLQEVKSGILPYKYKEAIEESERTGSPIFIVEGELTCEMVWSIGLPCVTFLGGSKQYRTNGDYSNLFKSKEIVLAPDRDEQGVAFMREIEADNPGAKWVYADPSSWEWQNLPSGNGYDLADYIEEGATKDDILSSIVSKGKHQGQNGKPTYEEIISTIENYVGLYANDARISYESANWLEQRGVKMSQQNIDKIIDEAKARIYGKEEIETIDALTIANADQCREWLVAGILPLGSVMLLAASGGTGKSTIVYNWALRIALGQRWSNRRCMKGKSLIIQSDEPLVDTSEKLGVIGFHDAGLEPGEIAFWENWRFGHMRQLEDYVRKHRPLFIAIDSLTACLAGMDVDLVKSNAGDVIYGLRDIANQYRCSIVILHHLNKQGGLRDSTSFVDNVSEVVKLTRMENNPDPNAFTLEWMKSRSGLTGKHALYRQSLTYGWQYAGPLGHTLDELDRVINAVDSRKNRRLTKLDVSNYCQHLDVTSTGRLLEVARRQGLITSSFITSEIGGRTRVYQSWDYQEPMVEPDPIDPVISESDEEEEYF